jgi:hypothetical protein
MPAMPFSEMPDHSRVWIFAAARPLNEQEAQVLLDQVDAFLGEWHAHGAAVVGGRDWRYDRFLMIAADETATGVSGCSGDALFGMLKETERGRGVPLLDSAPVWYRDRAGEIRALSRPEFRALVQSGEVDEETTVFNNTVTTISDVRVGKWETPLRDSWHAKAFPVAAAARG